MNGLEFIHVHTLVSCNIAEFGRKEFTQQVRWFHVRLGSTLYGSEGGGVGGADSELRISSPAD